MNSPFLFHIADLRSGRSEPRTFAAEVPVDWHVELSRVLPDPPLRFRFELSGIGGGVVVMGDIEATVRHRCYRCLTEWDEIIVRNVTQLVASTTDDENDYHTVGDTFDFEDMVRDELLLDLPIAPICGSDCKGLVDEAGSGLNTDFSEEEANESSPFSVLKDLLDTGD